MRCKCAKFLFILRTYEKILEDKQPFLPWQSGDYRGRMKTSDTEGKHYVKPEIRRTCYGANREELTSSGLFLFSGVDNPRPLNETNVQSLSALTEDT
jgi:hypothetical protein